MIHNYLGFDLHGAYEWYEPSNVLTIVIFTGVVTSRAFELSFNPVLNHSLKESLFLSNIADSKNAFTQRSVAMVIFLIFF